VPEDFTINAPNVEALKAETQQLRLRLQNMDSLRLLAEKRARMAENEAALWKGTYEQLRELLSGLLETGNELHGNRSHDQDLGAGEVNKTEGEFLEDQGGYSAVCAG
jgi:hypothetical protein